MVIEKVSLKFNRSDRKIGKEPSWGKLIGKPVLNKSQLIEGIE